MIVRLLVMSLWIGVSMNAFAASKEANPLLQPWTGPYGGVPPFDQVKVSYFKPALDIAMDESRKELKAIADQKDAPTFANTILAMEKSGDLADRVFIIYGTWASSMNTPDFQEIQTEYAPKLAAFGDEIVQNKALFDRIQAVYENMDKENLTPEQKRLVKNTYDNFVLGGAKLSEEDKKKVAKMNQTLASLYTQFDQNVLNDEEKDYLLLDSKEDLQGLPEAMVQQFAAEAAKRGKPGKWAVANTRSAMEPFLQNSARRDWREKAFRMWSSRGDQNGKTNNNNIVAQILQLRAERSKLLGFPTYAHWHLQNTMAKEPQVTVDLMMKVWKPAVKQVKKDVAEMQALVKKEGGNFEIQPWDYRYYAEKLRKAKYDLDFNDVKPYLQLANIQKAMFWTAESLFGLHFTQVMDVPVFNPDMTVFKVTNNKGDYVGLWYFDPYARAGKNSGAWMSAYRDQHRMDGADITTIVSNNSNFIKGATGEPVLLSWEDAETMFHEFGHALHGLNSNVTYPSLSGTSVPRDYVEFPSQFMENFLPTKEVLKFLVDSKGQQIPKELLKKMEKAKNFNEGFATVEFLASAILDMQVHLASAKGPIDPAAFEAQALKDIGMPPQVIMRHRIPHFGHLFSGDHYAAGYYSYLWSQVLEKDAFAAFLEAKGPYDKKVADRLKTYVFSPGNTMDPAEAYRKFRGRDAKVDAFLKSKGFL